METKGAIIVLDCGGQYAHLIASRIRRFGYRSEIHIAGTPAHQLADAAGIILSGGPQSVYEAGSPQADADIFDLGIPVLGICYGHQWIAHALGGQVTAGKTKEYGKMEIEISDRQSALFNDLPQRFVVWMSHGDAVTKLPDGFHGTAASETCAIAAMANDERRIYGVQFHLEVTHSENGMEMLKRFVELCTPAPWSMKGYYEKIAEEVRREVGDLPPSATARAGKKVFMLVSGGVDSTVAFTLLNKVLGTDRVQGLLVDTGLMRKGEIAQIDAAMQNIGINNLHIEDASALFFGRLRDVYEPEAKRAIIGDTFLDVQRDVAARLQLDGSDWMLGQGTIYPDTIETGGTAHADKIKTHHNRVPAIQKMMEEGRVIEPLKDLYKDEVRELGEEMGLAHELVWRHPFPGPGLGVRILCAAGGDQQSAISNQHDVDRSTLPIRSVGVQGDGRTYRQAVVLFDQNQLPTHEHWNLATSIPNTNPQFNRVLFCLTESQPKAFVLTPGCITQQRADLLREADAIVDEEMRKAGLYEEIWQFPVVLLPVGFVRGEQTVVLRPVHSEEAMTANAVDVPATVLKVMSQRIMKLAGISTVLLDLTNKPPGTIEWE